MKKLKLTLTVVAFLFVFATLLTSCGGGSKPSKSQIMEDLRTSFANDRSSLAEDMLNIQNMIRVGK